MSAPESAVGVTSPAYGSARIAMHWLTAVLIVSLVAVGFLMSDAEPESALRLWLSRTHAVLGFTTGIVLIARVAARLRSKPVAPLPMPPAREWVKRAVHFGMYAAMFAALASGMGTSIAGDWPSYLFGATPAAPDLHELAPRQGHEMFAFLLLGLGGAHVVGVLLYESQHGGALRRMLPGRSSEKT